MVETVTQAELTRLDPVIEALMVVQLQAVMAFFVSQKYNLEVEFNTDSNKDNKTPQFGCCPVVELQGKKLLL